MLHLLLPDGLPEIDRRRAGQPEGDDRGKLPCHLRHGVRRHHRASHVSQDRSIRRGAKPPHHLIDDHRKGVFHKIAEKHFVGMDHIAPPQLDKLEEKYWGQQTKKKSKV